MKTRLPAVLLPALGLSLTLAARGVESQEVVTKSPDGPTRVVTVRRVGDDDMGEKAPTTFLGVETAPAGSALASQLGLPAGTGLVVTRVVRDSPAAGVLQRDDLLTKLDDQILVDSRQLSVLVRSRKQGDEVALTIFRGGKEQSFKVKLGQRELPVRIGQEDIGPGGTFQFFSGEDLPDLARLRALPGLGRADVDNVLRMIGHGHADWFAAPQVRVFNREGGRAATILDLAEGNFVFSDDKGSVEVNAGDGHRELTVKNAKGAVTFKGPIASEADRRALPSEVTARLQQIENMDVTYEPGADFEQDATAVAPPAKTKIALPPGAWRAPANAPRPL